MKDTCYTYWLLREIIFIEKKIISVKIWKLCWQSLKFTFTMIQIFFSFSITLSYPLLQSSDSKLLPFSMTKYLIKIHNLKCGSTFYGNFNSDNNVSIYPLSVCLPLPCQLYTQHFILYPHKSFPAFTGTNNSINTPRIPPGEGEEDRRSICLSAWVVKRSVRTAESQWKWPTKGEKRVNNLYHFAKSVLRRLELLMEMYVKGWKGRFNRETEVYLSQRSRALERMY